MYRSISSSVWCKGGELDVDIRITSFAIFDGLIFHETFIERHILVFHSLFDLWFMKLEWFQIKIVKSKYHNDIISEYFVVEVRVINIL